MKKRKLLASLSLGLLVLFGGWVAVADGNDDGDRRNDFALFDGTNPANQPNEGAVCFAKKGKAFNYHVAVTNHISGGDGFVRVTYKDGDFVQFPIAPGGSFSFTQAAGSKDGFDSAIRISNGGSAARLVGVVSAERATCASCDAVAEGGIGDAGCDAIVPTP